MALVDIERVDAMLAMREGRSDAMRQSLDRSLAACLRAPYPYVEAKVRYLNGQFYAAAGRNEDARQQYVSALTICDRLGERRYRAHIERALNLIPQSADPTRPKRTRVRTRPA